jgi:hypothetical protein
MRGEYWTGFLSCRPSAYTRGFGTALERLGVFGSQLAEDISSFLIQFRYPTRLIRIWLLGNRMI